MMRVLLGSCASLLVVLGVRLSLAAGADHGSAGGATLAPDPGQATARAAIPAAAPAEAVRRGEETGSTLRAYHAALTALRLDAATALGVAQLRDALAAADALLALGRRDEAISLLAGLVESPRFSPLSGLEEGRTAIFMLGDALGRVGAYGVARDYLRRLIDPARQDVSYRRAISSLVDFGVDSGQPEVFLAELSRLPAGPSQSWAGDVAFLKGILHERSGRLEEALRAYAEVPQNCRFWAQATYRTGLIQVEGRHFAQGEAAFCKIADPKQTPRTAPLYGGNAFFQVRDLSRLALGRVAHEQYRFDDARYYYHLVPGDSERLPEALYEAATSRYESKDYETAHSLLNELKALERHHAYEDEALILDAYVDLARCQFPRADATLNEFLRRYEPVLNAARQLESEPAALRALLAGGSTQARGANGLGYPPEVSELLATSIQVDADYGLGKSQLADLDHQLSGLDGTGAELRDLRSRLGVPDAVTARLAAAVADSPRDRVERLLEQTAAIRRLLREAANGAPGKKDELSAIKQELVEVEAGAVTLQATLSPVSSGGGGQPADALSKLLIEDAALSRELDTLGRALRASLVQRQDELAVQALSRLERRLTRLVRRARAGRIETVLGRKRALELEVEALSQGYLPRGAIDSLDAARYLADDEEYWPFDGEDWDDEYVGGEGLR